MVDYQDPTIRIVYHLPPDSAASHVTYKLFTAIRPALLRQVPFTGRPLESLGSLEPNGVGGVTNILR